MLICENMISSSYKYTEIVSFFRAFDSHIIEIDDTYVVRLGSRGGGYHLMTTQRLNGIHSLVPSKRSRHRDERKTAKVV